MSDHIGEPNENVAPMTMDERIEAAARELHVAAPKREGAIDRPWQMLPADWQNAFRDTARTAISAAFPELHGDQPKGWIAPAALRGRVDAVLETFIADEESGYRSRDRQYVIEMLQPMRDAYLGKGDGDNVVAVNQGRINLWNRFGGRCHYCDRMTLHPERITDPNLILCRREIIACRKHAGGGGAGNVVLACTACNQMKGCLNEREFVDAVLWMVERDLEPSAKRGGHGYHPISSVLRREGYPKLAIIDRLAYLEGA